MHNTSKYSKPNIKAWQSVRAKKAVAHNNKLSQYLDKHVTHPDFGEPKQFEEWLRNQRRRRKSN